MDRQRHLAPDLRCENHRLPIRAQEKRGGAQDIKCDQEHRRAKRNRISSHSPLKYFSAPAFIGSDMPLFAVSFEICLPTACAACRRSRFEKIAFVIL